MNSTFNIHNSKLNAPVVLKIGGNDIDDPAFLKALAAYVAAVNTPLVIVHGGGKEINWLQEKLGIETRKLDGLRVTDDDTLAVVEMVLRGRVNNRLVRALEAAGVDAVGMSGADRGIIKAHKLEHSSGDLGRVGEPDSVRGEVLLDLLAQGVTPVIAPLGLGDDGENYNINADHAAAAVAQAIGAGQVVFLTNVRAVLVKDQPQRSLSRQQALDLIAQGVIFGGMIPKVQTALDAVELGIPQALITDLEGLRQGSGTVFHANGAMAHDDRAEVAPLDVSLNNFPVPMWAARPASPAAL